MDDPRLQTAEEWLAGYAGEAVKQPAKPSAVYFRYLDHRTTRTGSVVLSFESLDGTAQAVRFFNVSLEGKAKKYPAGKRGQFNPPEHGEFRRFWMHAVGKPPPRWARVHKSMRSHLSSLLFAGSLEQAEDGKGRHYFKLKGIAVADGHLTGTEQAQNGHQKDTDWTPF